MSAGGRVRVGERYQAAGGRGVWIVIGVTDDHAGNPHARLQLETDHTRTVAIAFAALSDRRLYRPVPRETNGTDDEDDRHKTTSPRSR